MFGCEAKIGISSSSLPTEVTATLQTEDDLAAAVAGSSSIPVVPACCDDGDDNTTTPNPVPSTSSAVPDDDDVQQTLADQTTQIRKRHAKACSGQIAQAERVVNRRLLVHVDLKAGVAGDNVAVPIPLVDSGRGDPRNILGVIVNRNLETDQYTIAVRAGILKRVIPGANLTSVQQRILTLDDVDQEKQVSLRTAVVAQSTAGGQGFVKCSCNGVRKCKTNRFKCFKAILKCNSRCHASLNCANK